MKKYFVLASTILLFQFATSQTLFTIGNEVVLRSDFMKNFLRNNNNLTGDRTTSLKENLTLFINYRLKVKDAYAKKLDTLPNQREDLQGFKRQIEGKFLTEDKMMKLLTLEAFNRMQKDIRLSHIIVVIDKNTKDTSLPSKKIAEAYNKLNQGADFAAIAKQYSEDPNVAENGGDVGYITAFTLPYNLENLAYNTPIGKHSNIYKSTIGYHIFKPAGERRALGKMNAAQILIQNFPNASPATLEASKKQIDEIYEKLKKGDNFENLARAFSNDMYSASSGGVMQEFGVGKFDVQFENNFAKLKDEEYSKPFMTSFGWHILKRIGNIVPKETLDKEMEQEITAKINNDSRRLRAEEVFLQNILKMIQYKPASVDKGAIFEKLNSGTVAANSKIDDKTILHRFVKQNITVGDFWNFAKDAKNNAQFKDLSNDNLLNEYVKVTALEYYKSHLEEYSTDYKDQVKEFKDGNLLFEAMETNVWNKSANDEVGLKNYFNANRSKYKWEKSADALLFSSNNLSEAISASELLKKNPAQWKEVLLKYQGSLNADSGRFELVNIPVADKTFFNEGMTTAPFSPNNDGNYIFAYIFKLYEANTQRSFEDAKGLVINDYQVKLEEEWLNALKKKYPVKINEAVWKDILTKGK